MVDPDRNRDAHTDRRRTETAAFALVLFLSSVVPIPSGPTVGDSGSGALSYLASLGIGLTDPFHFLGYAVLAALVARTTGPTRRGLLAAAGVAVAFGFGIELVQSPIPWRSFAWGDVAVNAIGAIVGITTVAILRR